VVCAAAFEVDHTDDELGGGEEARRTLPGIVLSQRSKERLVT
jgi:hypothetical protein